MLINILAKLILLWEIVGELSKPFLSQETTGIYSFLPLSNLSLIELTNLEGNSAAIYLLTLRLVSTSKLEAVFLAQCNSPIITLHLYLTETFDVQCTGKCFYYALQL